MTAAPTKIDLFAWVERQTQLDTPIKYLLEKLASYADADGITWAKIETLAGHINKTERQVQRYLSKLKDDGLIVDTGERHRLKDSTRSVPLYRLAAEARCMGDTDVTHGPDVSVTPVSPIDGVWVTSEASMGDNCVTRIRTLEEPKGANAPKSGAREAVDAVDEAAFEALLAAWLTTGKPNSRTKPAEARAAWREVVADHDPGLVVAAARRALAEDEDFRRRGAPGLQRWLADRQFEGWLVAAGETTSGSEPPTRPAWRGPAEIREAIVRLNGEAFARSYLDPAEWREHETAVRPANRYAATQLAEAARRLRLGQAGEGAVLIKISEPVKA